MNKYELSRTDTKQAEATWFPALAVTGISGLGLFFTTSTLWRLIQHPAMSLPLIAALSLGEILLIWALLSALWWMLGVAVSNFVASTHNPFFHLISKWGLPGLRRLLLGSAGASLLLVGSTMPAFATEADTDVVWGWTGPEATQVQDLDSAQPAQNSTTADVPTDSVAQAELPNANTQATSQEESQALEVASPTAQEIPSDTEIPQEPTANNAQAMATSPQKTADSAPSHPETVPSVTFRDLPPAKRLSSPLPAVDTSPATASEEVVNVKAGDSLWSISRQILGADATDQEIASFWPKLYEKNRAVIGSNPNLIYPGQVLVIADMEQK